MEAREIGVKFSRMILKRHFGEFSNENVGSILTRCFRANRLQNKCC